MKNHVMKKTMTFGLLSGMLITGAALPAAAGTGPRADLNSGNIGVGFDPGAFSVDLGIGPNLSIGVDGRESGASTAWGGLGARATLRVLGKADSCNFGVGGRLSLPGGNYGAINDFSLRDVPSSFKNTGAASAFMLVSMPITPWFILRYPIGMTFFVGPGQNGGQAWTFGGANWSPEDSRTLSLSAGDKNFYLPLLQFLPEAAFKFGGFEATLFGSSLAGFRRTY